MSNINDTYFDGHYKEIWRTMIPAELTVKETDFMVSHFNLGAGSTVLDLMCGYGRHALALGEKGIAVTAIDNQPDYINEIAAKAAANALPVKTVCTDVLHFTTGDRFELAICMGNSLNFYDAPSTLRLLKNIAAMLKPGGHLLINSWSIAEIAFKQAPVNSWAQVGAFKFLTSSKILFQPSRIESETIIIPDKGETETRPAVDYIFSLNETEQMLKEAGFTLQEIYSIPGRKKFTIGEPRAYLVAGRV